MKVYNLMVPQENKEKTYWNKIGVMFENNEGKRSIKLNMFPDLSIHVFEQQPRQNNNSNYNNQPNRNQNNEPENNVDCNDPSRDIPF